MGQVPSSLINVFRSECCLSQRRLALLLWLSVSWCSPIAVQYHPILDRYPRTPILYRYCCHRRYCSISPSSLRLMVIPHHRLHYHYRCSRMYSVGSTPSDLRVLCCFRYFHRYWWWWYCSVMVGVDSVRGVSSLRFHCTVGNFDPPISHVPTLAPIHALAAVVVVAPAPAPAPVPIGTVAAVVGDSVAIGGGGVVGRIGDSFDGMLVCTVLSHYLHHLWYSSHANRNSFDRMVVAVVLDTVMRWVVHRIGGSRRVLDDRMLVVGIYIDLYRPGIDRGNDLVPYWYYFLVGGLVLHVLVFLHCTRCTHYNPDTVYSRRVVVSSVAVLHVCCVIFVR
uniref:Putative N5-carboxyaminoimidazole ribonucleotide mutase n=1 Tax=Lygus hesperus TaxID=30085 RepID=A0A0A9YF04_LYGHE